MDLLFVCKCLLTFMGVGEMRKPAKPKPWGFLVTPRDPCTSHDLCVLNNVSCETSSYAKSGFPVLLIPEILEGGYPTLAKLHETNKARGGCAQKCITAGITFQI